MDANGTVIDSKATSRKDRTIVGVFTAVVLVVAAVLVWMQFDDSAKSCYKVELCGFKISQRVNPHSQKWKDAHAVEQVKNNSDGGVDVCCNISDSKLLPGFEKMILSLDKSDRIVSIYCITTKAASLEDGVAYFDMLLPRLESQYGKIQKWINTNFGDSPLLRYATFPSVESPVEELHFDFVPLGNSCSLYLKNKEPTHKAFMKSEEWERLHPKSKFPLK